MWYEEHSTKGRFFCAKANTEEPSPCVPGDSGIRQHSIDVDGMIEIVKNMDHPTYIVLQENGRYVEVVPFYGSGRGRKAWAVLDFGDMKNPEFMNGYEGGSFHVLVTAFEPDDLKNYLKSHGNKIIYPKK